VSASVCVCGHESFPPQRLRSPSQIRVARWCGKKQVLEVAMEDVNIKLTQHVQHGLILCVCARAQCTCVIVKERAD
jgi:hypothetical protein